MWGVEVNRYEIQPRTLYNRREFWRVWRLRIVLKVLYSPEINSSCHRLFLCGVLFTYLIPNSLDLTVTYIVYSLEYGKLWIQCMLLF